MELTYFYYTIVHVAVDDNVWEERFSRWGAPRSRVVRRVLTLLISLVSGPGGAFYWNGLSMARRKDLLESQRQRGISSHNLTGDKSGLLRKAYWAVYITAYDVSMQPRILVSGHCRQSGHRGEDTTLRGIFPYFTWPTIKSDVTVLVTSCPNCSETTGGIRFTWPLGHGLHATRPNELIHFDFLYMGPSSEGNYYSLFIKDDVTAFTILFPVDYITTNTAVCFLLQWLGLLGVLQWVSDQGTHILHGLIGELNWQLRYYRHLTTPDCTKRNGSAEVVCKERLHATRPLLSELYLSDSEWQSVITLIQSAPKHASRPSFPHYLFYMPSAWQRTSYSNSTSSCTNRGNV